MSDYVLEMTDVSKHFFGVPALKNIELNLKAGEVLALCGENGAGKSTLMKILSGSYGYGSYEGRIIVNKSECRFHSTRDAERLGIEMIYQEINLHLDLSVAENIFLGNQPRNRAGLVDWKRMYADAESALKMVGLKLDVRKKVRSLNTSQQQLITIARACVRKPRILVLDEPTSALTTNEAEHLFRIIAGLKEQEIGCIYISHKMDEVFELADRITILRDGQYISTYSRNEATREKVIEDMVGRKIDSFYSHPENGKGEEIFRIENMYIPHPMNPDKCCLENINLAVKKGEIVGLAGLVGSGRSELLEYVYTGEYLKEKKESCRGRVFISGEQAEIGSPSEALKAGIAMLSEDRKRNGFVGTMNILKNISLANLSGIAKSGILNPGKERRLCGRYSKLLSIKMESGQSSILTLSGGNQQKVVLSKWLATGPRVLILDEPTRGIDVGAKAEIYQIISQLAEQGVAIIMISSEMPEILAMCDRIIVIGNGDIQAEFSREEASQEKIMAAASLQAV